MPSVDALNFSFPYSRICRPFPELGGKIGSLEQEQETVKAVVGQSVEALAQSLKERHALEGELDQLHNIE